MTNLNLRYSQKEINIFLTILESVLRGGDEGKATIGGVEFKIKLEDVKRPVNVC